MSARALIFHMKHPQDMGIQICSNHDPGAINGAHAQWSNFNRDLYSYWYYGSL